jgi:two-component system, chemotaxis family, chemotaxis protein CheY
MHPANPATKPRALVIDDDPAVLALLSHGLSEAGVEALTAEDGAAGLRLLVEHLLEVDLLVTDLEMPGLDGVTVVRTVRAEGGERDLAILVLADAIAPADRELLARLGVDEMIEKREGSDHAVRRAVALATSRRDQRVGASGAEVAGPVPLGPVRLVKVPVFLEG